MKGVDMSLKGTINLDSFGSPMRIQLENLFDSGDPLPERVYVPNGSTCVFKTYEESFWYLTGLLDALSHFEE